jgi:hypothetical protein
VQRRGIAAGFLEQGEGYPPVLLEHREHEVLGDDLGVAATGRELARITYGFLAFRGQSVGAHRGAQ